MTLGKKLTAHRKASGFTQQQLGELLNVSAQAVSKWENDQAEPDLHTLRKISILYRIKIDDLLFGEAPAAEEDTAPAAAPAEAAAPAAPAATSADAAEAAASTAAPAAAAAPAVSAAAPAAVAAPAAQEATPPPPPRVGKTCGTAGEKADRVLQRLRLRGVQRVREAPLHRVVLHHVLRQKAARGAQTGAQGAAV